jgi:WD40 repeat protein
LATASRDYKARLWETHTGRELGQLSHTDGVLDVAFSPDGRWLATASADHTARLWDVTTKREVTRLAHDRRVEAILFSPDGRWLAARSGKEVLVWEVAQLLTVRIATDQQAARLRHRESVRAMAFSPDGRRLATATGNPPGTGDTQLWDTATGQEISHAAYNNWVSALAFSPDGGWLVSGGGDRLAQVWLLQPKDLIDEACARLTRNLTRLEWQQYFGEASYRPTCPNLPVPEE